MVHICILEAFANPLLNEHVLRSSIAATCCQLISTKVDAQRDKLDGRRSTKLTVLATFDD